MEFLKESNIFMDEWRDQLEKQFINPLKKMGYEFAHYGHQSHDQSCQGIHTLIFNWDYKTKHYMNWIKDLMVDDDGQPMSNYTYYLGTLWIYIPYTG